MDDDKTYARLVAKAKAAAIGLIALAITTGITLALLSDASAAVDDTRTIADLEGSAQVDTPQISEALQYRRRPVVFL